MRRTQGNNRENYSITLYLPMVSISRHSVSVQIFLSTKMPYNQGDISDIFGQLYTNFS